VTHACWRPLDAQVAYAREHVHADKGECRNIVTCANSSRLYQQNGQKTEYLDQGVAIVSGTADETLERSICSTREARVFRRKSPS